MYLLFVQDQLGLFYVTLISFLRAINAYVIPRVLQMSMCDGDYLLVPTIKIKNEKSF